MPPVINRRIDQSDIGERPETANELDDDASHTKACK